MKGHLVASIALGAALVCVASAPANAQSAADGATIISTRCNVCHSDPSTAPSLKGAYGRLTASTDYGYSDALKAHNKDTWTDASLDAFLTDTAAFAPGTYMDFKEPDPKARASVIAYLKTLK